MYKNILATINEHLNSEVTARYALNLARVCNARFVLTFIAEKKLTEGDIETAHRSLHKLFEEARDLGLQVESISLSGEPLKEMKKIVIKEDIDIAFISTRKEDIKKRFYAGTTARRLLIGLPCSVAMVRVVHFGKVHPRKILVPLKARIPHLKERAFFTAKMTEAFGAKVYLFHCTMPEESFFLGKSHLTPLQWGKRLKGDLAEFIELLKQSGIESEDRLSTGATAKKIALEASSRRHDLIIMGASERSLLTSILKGNPVEELLRETPCNLIILKSRHAD
ncbi:MAG: universal stress protein [Nitrospirae bacterium]|nr:MAG: universal stress protein [Nitrospirota bacterium]